MIKFPFYEQPDTMDCAPTCLRMIAKHYGKNCSMQRLRNYMQIGKEGVNLLGIGEAAEALGMRSQAVKIDFETLVNDAPLPAILHWDQNHFVVLYKIKKRKQFIIADPARGLMTLSKEDIWQHWISDLNNGEKEGIVLLLEPTPDFYSNQDDEKNKDEKLGFHNVFRYIYPYKNLIAQLFIGLGVGSLLQLFLPFLTQSIVDTGVATGNIHFVYIVLLAQLALFTGRMVVDFVRGWLLLHISTRVNISILTDFLIKLMKLPAAFFDSKHTGDILQRMSDHKRIESFLTGSSLSILFSFINLIIFSFVLAYFNLAIFSVFVTSAIVYACWVILFLKRRRQLDYKRFEIAAKEQSTTIQLIQGMQEIKLNGAERPIRWIWERLQAKLFKLGIKNLALNQWQQTGAFFINEGKNILITFLSAKAVIDGQMTLGAMLAIQYIIGQLNSPIEQMISFVQSWQNAKISMERLNEVHAMEDEEPAYLKLQRQLPPSMMKRLVGGNTDHYNEYEFAGKIELDMPAGQDKIANGIVFDNVSFTYPGAGNEKVLKNVSFHIPQGQTTAIVGTSGSGKTTLIKLLLRFYDNQSGEIKLDNTPLKSVSHRYWRSLCGVVMQETYLFADTIARNIAVGQEKIDRDRLRMSATIANIQAFIESLPLGYNTKIGANGMSISMGQKQRILIARAVYKNPSFIFLDEATNSLDANNESEIVSNLGAFFEGRTVVVVAHRLSTVRNARQIIVLNKGYITEKGTHQELIELRGEYYELVKNQLELAT